MLRILSLLCLVGTSSAYMNVKGGKLQHCSESGMALTGFTRNGQCVDQNDDQGSHHICINLASTTGGNFCTVTRQPNWCSSKMECDGQSGQCPVEHWCVCQWAFASYLAKAGGCDEIQDIICEATNIEAFKAYQKSSDQNDKDALACLKKRCNIGVEPLHITE